MYIFCASVQKERTYTTTPGTELSGKMVPVVQRDNAYQSLNALFYVCSQYGDIRPRDSQQQCQVLNSVGGCVVGLCTQKQSLQQRQVLINRKGGCFVYRKREPTTTSSADQQKRWLLCVQKEGAYNNAKC